MLLLRPFVRSSHGVGVTRFELATPRPPDVCSNRTELHPVDTTLTDAAKVVFFLNVDWRGLILFSSESRVGVLLATSKIIYPLGSERIVGTIKGRLRYVGWARYKISCVPLTWRMG